MKTFSRLILFTITCLVLAMMVVGITPEVYADDSSLEVAGDTGEDKDYEKDDSVETLFIAKIDGVPVENLKLDIRVEGLTDVIITNNGTTDTFGRVTVTGIINNDKYASISAKWEAEAKSVKAEFDVIGTTPHRNILS